MLHLTQRQRDAADLTLNSLIVLTTAWAVLMYFIGEPDILGSHDVQCFKYFTTDSNILAAIGSLLYLGFFLANRKDPDQTIPLWVHVFKFVGTVAASITLLTVVFFLAPLGAMNGKGLQTVLLFFTGNVFVLHLSTPVLTIISTLYLEHDVQITRKQALWGTLPTIMYSIVYLIMVVLLKRWDDWYGFTFGGQYQYVPVVMCSMFLFSLAVSMTERRLKNSERCSKQEKPFQEK